MTDGFVQVPPDSTGKQIKTYDVSGKQVQAVALNDSSGNELAPLTNTQLRASAVTVALDATSLSALENINVTVSTGTVDLGAGSLAALENVTVGGTVELGATSLAALESVTASGPLTDTQLRASAVPVSVSGVATESTISAINTKTPALGQTTMAGSVPVTLASNQSSVPVSGTFWQATQPVSAASLPLPTGAATSALQTTGNTSLGNIDIKTPTLVSGRVPVDGSGVIQPISAAALPLPTGAATSALQTTGNSSLSSIDGKLSGTLAVNTGLSQPITDAQLRASAVPVSVSGEVDITPASPAAGSYLPVRLTDGSAFYTASGGGGSSNPNGQATMANSAPVVIASDQTTIPVSVSGVSTEATLAAINTKLPTAQVALPDSTVAAMPVRQCPQRVIATSYATAGSGVDASQEVIIAATGSGMAVNRTGGNLVITSGTTANSETVIRSFESVDGRVSFSFGDTLSQRIVNNNFYRELVDVIGDGLAYTIVNATTVNITKTAHGFTTANIGQRIDICAITGAAGVPMEGVIAAIPDANTIQFTVAGWPASGSGTCSLTGWNKIEFNYTGTSATVININTRRRGYQNTSTAMTISTSASGSLIICTLQNDRVTVSTGTLAIGTALTDRTVIFTNIPEPDVDFYYQIRAKNGTTAPASTTTWTCAFTRLQDFIATQTEIVGLRNFGTGVTLPVSGSVTAGISAGTSAIGKISSTGIWYDDSSTVLAANATFTGSSRDLAATATATAFTAATVYMKEFRVSAESDQSGTLWVEVSRDNANWRRVKSVATAAVAGGGQYAEIVLQPSWRYARAGFTNGATLQTRFTIGSVALGG